MKCPVCGHVLITDRETIGIDSTDSVTGIIESEQRCINGCYRYYYFSGLYTEVVCGRVWEYTRDESPAETKKRHKERRGRIDKCRSRKEL